MATAVEFPIWDQAVIPTEPIRQFTVDEYHAIIHAGILTEDDNVELLEGYLVEKMPKNPRHSAILRLIQSILYRILPEGYHISNQDPMTTETSEPEPDLMIIRGAPLDYLDAHPTPNDAALVVEVSDSSLRRDRTTKKRIFAQSGVAAYWIINIQENQIEEYTKPSVGTTFPDFEQRNTYRDDDILSLNLDGTIVGSIRAGDLFP